MAVRAVDNLRVLDYRAADERMPAGLPDVRRTFDDVKFQSFGEAAIISATMTERAASPAPAPPRTVVSLVGQTWRRQRGVWYLAEVRIVNRYATSLDGGSR